MEQWLHHFEGDVQEWHWWYQVRRELLEVFLSRLPLDRREARLLDVGCGTGAAAPVLARHGLAVGIDRAGAAAQAGVRRFAAYVQGDVAARLPFADESFDAISALDVLEHLDDDVAAARELRRLLKPGGAAIVFVPALMSLWGYNDELNHHRRRYRREQLIEVLVQAGFIVEDAGYFNFTLLAPTFAARTLQRLLPKMTSGMEHSTKRTPLNEVLAKIFRVEVPLIRRGGHLPLGSSCYAVGRK